jgi:hypothetical protein
MRDMRRRDAGSCARASAGTDSDCRYPTQPLIPTRVAVAHLEGRHSVAFYVIYFLDIPLAR